MCVSAAAVVFEGDSNRKSLWPLASSVTAAVGGIIIVIGRFVAVNKRRLSIRKYNCLFLHPILLKR